MKIDYEKYKDIKIDKEKFKDIPTNVEQLRNCLAICYVLMEDKDKEIERLNKELKKYRYTPKAHFKETMKLRKENKKLHSIIKEVREYIENVYPNSEKLHSMFLCEDYISNYGAIELLEILDKVEEK